MATLGTSTKTRSASSIGRDDFYRKVRKQKSLIFMTIPIVIYVFIMRYLPLAGLTMAFQRYRPGRPFAEQEWVGFMHFERLFTDTRFFQVLRNTLAMGFINLVLGFVTAILLAILINEIKHNAFKRIVQSVSYLPHFLSWVIVANFLFAFLATDGMINNVLMKVGLIKENIAWLGTPNYFWGIIGAANVWKSVGWNSIIYLAAIVSISPELYEAAYIDGASRLQKILYITLPGIKSTFVVLLILNLGFILNAGGFEIQYLLRNGIVSDVSDTIDIFVLIYGIADGNFAYATAAGMFKSVVSIVLITMANLTAKKMGEETLI